jgi:hypothetical protein
MAAARLVPSAHATYIFAQLSRYVKNACAKARRSKLAAKRAIASLARASSPTTAANSRRSPHSAYGCSKTT